MIHYMYDLYGRYSGQSDSATDSSTTVAPPELIADWNWNGYNWVFAPNINPIAIFYSPIPSRVPGLIKQVDADVDRLMKDCIGERATEYQRAESQAEEYKAANYTGTVPEAVQSWADTKKWTAKEAADDILLQAYKWRQAAALIRRNRLKAKEDVRTSTTTEEVAAALSQWQGFVSAIRNQLGV